MGVRFCSLSSGSSGNCQYIETENMKILIDAGFSGKRTEELLASIDVCPSTLDGIFITHEHIDHIKGAGVLSRRYDLPLYANEGTWSGMESKIGKMKEENIKIFTTEKLLEMKDLTINPINIFHDALEPVGYVLYYKNKKISVVTDTGTVDNNIMEKIKNSNLYLIESNHDANMLRDGDYPWYLKKRIASTKGHLSNDDAAKILSETILGKEEIVLLGHLSKDNNKPELAYNTIKSKLNDGGININKDMILDMTYRDKISKVYNL